MVSGQAMICISLDIILILQTWLQTLFDEGSFLKNLFLNISPHEASLKKINKARG